MKRREFLRAATAAAATPMVPGPIAGAIVPHSTTYAQALDAANKWAYMTVGNLKLALGVDETTSAGLIERLRADGVLGEAGTHGLSVSRKFLAEHTKITAVHLPHAASAHLSQTARSVDPQGVDEGRTALRAELNLKDVEAAQDDVPEILEVDHEGSEPKGIDLGEPFEGEHSVEPAKSEGV